MNMHIEPTGGHYPAFPGDSLRAGPDDDVNVRLHIRIASLTYRGDLAVLQADIRLNDSPIVEY